MFLGGCHRRASDLQDVWRTLSRMTATDVLPGDTMAAHVDLPIEVASTLAASRPAMGNRLFGASLGSLAFQAGHLGAGLGWHGSVAAEGVAT
jgi:hypothetical protein